MRHLIMVFSLLLGLSLLSACSKKTATGGTDLGSTNPTLPVVPPTAPVVAPTSPLAISLYTVFSGTTGVNALKFSETGTETCTVTDAAPAITCTVIVPEGRLYFSDLGIQYSWLNNKCRLLFFQPYSYRASTSVSYRPPGNVDPIDCAAVPISSSCFGGAAKSLVPEFPRYSVLVHLPDEANPSPLASISKKVPSGFSQATSSNRTVVNDLPAGKLGSTFNAADLGGAGDGYIAGTYRNYRFECRDDWYDPVTYSINLNVREEDSKAGNPVLNDFFTWKEAP